MEAAKVFTDYFWVIQLPSAKKQKEDLPIVLSLKTGFTDLHRLDAEFSAPEMSSLIRVANNPGIRDCVVFDEIDYDPCDSQCDIVSSLKTNMPSDQSEAPICDVQFHGKHRVNVEEQRRFSTHRRAIKANKKRKTDSSVPYHMTDKTKRWAEGRYNKVVCIVSKLEEEKKVQFSLAATKDHVFFLCDLATQAVLYCNDNWQLKLGNSGLWAAALCQQAWLEENHGRWEVVEDDEGNTPDWMFWTTLKDSVETISQCFKVQNEHRSYGNQSVQEMANGKSIKRRIESHGFGSNKEQRMKLECLDMLLKMGKMIKNDKNEDKNLDENKGLDDNIISLMRPQIVRCSTTPARKVLGFQTRARQAAEKRHSIFGSSSGSSSVTVQQIIDES